jgi:hypothetical protein
MVERGEELPKFEGEKPAHQESEVPKPLFEGGWVLASPKALNALAEAELELMAVVSRHLVGDWGDVTEEEKLLNDLAIDHGKRITSVYQLPTGNEIWVVTAGDRQMTWLKLSDQPDPHES